MTINPAEVSQGTLHNYLLSAVAPRPIAFASTIDKDGNVNLSPFSFFNVFSSNPPVMIFSPAYRGRDGSSKHTLDNVLAVPECTISMVNYPIVEQMSLASTEYGQGVNEFVKAGLTEMPSEMVKPPFVGESPVAFECLVNQVIPLNRVKGGGSGNLVICEVKRIHIQEKFLNEKGHLDTTKMDLVGRMGGVWYNRSTPDALFEIPKPLRTKGIGVDQLPEAIKNSTILTGNNLGRLGNIEQLPSTESIAEIKNDPIVKSIIEKNNDFSTQEKELHQLAKGLLEDGNIEKALKILLLK
jgi:Conserved protein/domain typically associated with flavoprotein oxygenases, DIM6/NTAB family